MRKRTALACLTLLLCGASMALVPVATQAQEQCREDHRKVVHFEHDKDGISAEAAAQLDSFAARYATGQHDADAVFIRSHADRSEVLAESLADVIGAEYLAGLSQRRANKVRNYLVRRGVPDAMILTEAFGATRPSADNAPAAKNRRVELVFGPGSGW